jgi:Leucine-rich repeat (LRR) protein
MALLVEGRKLFFCAESPADNVRWYLYLVCKNSELTYLRKLKHTDQRSDNRLLLFMEQPMVSSLCLDNVTLSVDTVVSLSGPIRAHDSLRLLSLRYSKLNDLGLSTLTASLKSNTSIETLDLQGNNLTVDSAKSLASVLASNSTLKYLLLAENQIGDKGMVLLAEALAGGAGASLQRLDLTNNHIGAAGAEAFAEALEKGAKTLTLSEVHLNDNRVGNRGALRLLQMCQVNERVSVLHLQNNQLMDDGLPALAAELEKNQSLKRVYLAFNSLESPESRQVLVRTILTNRSLEFFHFGQYPLERSDLCAMRLLNDCSLLQSGQ